ncbi:MAG: hypothetical protein M1448_04085 [Candidatus Marsarchaeota archaeon]|nr:hypothetical protein [Candidatus Marsarchaeota archaeon]
MGEKSKNIGIIIASAMMGATGQLFFKLSFSGSFLLLVSAGIFFYGTATLLYFYVLSRTHLSWAYGMGGLSYLFSVFLAARFLSESIPPARWAGVLLITAGIMMVGST